jgi:hypothetical protein
MLRILRHPVIIFIIACAGVIGTTWNVSDSVVVQPCNTKNSNLKDTINELNNKITGLNKEIEKLEKNNQTKIARKLQNDSTTITLQDFDKKHDFILSSIIDNNDTINVTINIVNISTDSCKIYRKISPKCDKEIKIDTGIYHAFGSFILDESRGTIRFSGSLTLSGIAQANYLNTSILSAYTTDI